MLEEQRRREKEDAAEKRKGEFRYISTELNFRLEEFAQKCALVAVDNGYEPQEGAELIADAPCPVLTLEDIDGEWKSIPAGLLYLIREQPVRLKGIHPLLKDIYDYDYDPPENSHWFSERQKQYAAAGLRALRLARRLRSLGGYPQTRLASGPRSPLQVMWDVHRRELRNRKIFTIARSSNSQPRDASASH